MVRVKICGLMREEDVQAAVSMGADAIGFVCGFPSSPRNNSLARATELARTVPPFVDTVLVTNGDTVSRNPEGIKKMQLTTLQLYGTYDLAYVRDALGLRIIKPIHARAGVGFDYDMPPDALLLDSHAPGEVAQTAGTADWAVCREIREKVDPIPVILAGGLTPKNVSKAISEVRPYGVDVSSGVEAAPGLKDHHKMMSFINETRARG